MALASSTLNRYLLFVFLLVSHLALAIPSWPALDLQIRDAKNIKESYDYIIVGGGTAGLTIADRLTTSGKCLHNLIPALQALQV